MATVTRSATSGESEVHYPDSDGQPMAETPIHRQNLTDLIGMIEDRFADDPMVYVSGNMFLYYVEGVPSRNVAPDVFVVRGVDKGLKRRVYKVWTEGHAPDLVIELTSDSTKDEDVEKKFGIYRDVLKVKEYFLFDPEGEWLDPPLRGYRLKDGAYVSIEPVEGRLPSEVLGVHLERDGLFLRLWDPSSGRRIPTRPEAIAEREAKLRARDAAIKAKDTALKARDAAIRSREAELKTKDAAIRSRDAELKTKDAALEAKEAENERLRREIEELRRGSR